MGIRWQIIFWNIEFVQLINCNFIVLGSTFNSPNLKGVAGLKKHSHLILTLIPVYNLFSHELHLPSKIYVVIHKLCKIQFLKKWFSIKFPYKHCNIFLTTLSTRQDGNENRDKDYLLLVETFYLWILIMSVLVNRNTAVTLLTAGSGVNRVPGVASAFNSFSWSYDVIKWYFKRRPPIT